MTEMTTVEQIVQRSKRAMGRASKSVRRNPQAARAFLDSIGLGDNGRMGASARRKPHRNLTDSRFLSLLPDAFEELGPHHKGRQSKNAG